jgi:transcriptional regulator with XRE-family HTH domain
MNTLIGRKIASKRIEKGLSHEGLASKLQLSQSDISKIENGTKELHDDERIKIAKLLDMPIIDLVDTGSINISGHIVNSSPNIAHNISIQINININLDDKDNLSDKVANIINEVKKIEGV